MDPQRLITEFTVDSHLSLSKPDQSTSCLPISLPEDPL